MVGCGGWIREEDFVLAADLRSIKSKNAADSEYQKLLVMRVTARTPKFFSQSRFLLCVLFLFYFTFNKTCRSRREAERVCVVLGTVSEIGQHDVQREACSGCWAPENEFLLRDATFHCRCEIILSWDNEWTDSAAQNLVQKSNDMFRKT